MFFKRPNSLSIVLLKNSISQFLKKWFLMLYVGHYRKSSNSVNCFTKSCSGFKIKFSEGLVRACQVSSYMVLQVSTVIF